MTLGHPLPWLWLLCVHFLSRSHLWRLWFGLRVLPNCHHFACGEWLERRQMVFDFFWFSLLSASPEFCILLLARTWQSAPPPYIAGSSLDAKALNKYLAPLYSLIHSIHTLLSASKPSLHQLSSLHFPVGARKKFLLMVPSITDYVGPTYSQHK